MLFVHSILKYVDSIGVVQLPIVLELIISFVVFHLFGIVMSNQMVIRSIQKYLLWINSGFLILSLIVIFLPDMQVTGASNVASFMSFLYLLLVVLQCGFLYMEYTKRNFKDAFIEEQHYRLALKIAAAQLILVIIILISVLNPSLFYLIPLEIAAAAFLIGFGSWVIKHRTSNQNKIKNQIDANLKNKLDHAMEKDQLWKDPELTLSQLAASLGLSECELTKLLNQQLNTSFYQIINKWRVDEVKKLLLKSSLEQFTILAVAYDSGFSSKSTFYRIFKEYTGLTPRQYIQSLK